MIITKSNLSFLAWENMHLGLIISHYHSVCVCVRKVLTLRVWANNFLAMNNCSILSTFLNWFNPFLLEFSYPFLVLFFPQPHIYIYIIGKLHTNPVGLKHDLAQHLALARGGGVSWTQMIEIVLFPFYHLPLHLLATPYICFSSNSAVVQDAWILV